MEDIMQAVVQVHPMVTLVGIMLLVVLVAAAMVEIILHRRQDRLILVAVAVVNPKMVVQEF
jgi:hypothetical protein